MFFPKSAYMRAGIYALCNNMATFTLTRILMESYKGWEAGRLGGWEAVKPGGLKIKIKKTEDINA